MSEPRLRIVASADSSARQRPLQALFDALTTPATTVAEANARMREWREAAQRPQLGLVREEPRAKDWIDVPDDEEMAVLLATGDALLGEPEPPLPPSRPRLTRIR